MYSLRSAKIGRFLASANNFLKKLRAFAPWGPGHIELLALLAFSANLSDSANLAKARI
jgi:hypothetical protein